MTNDRAAQLLEKINALDIGIIGDFCVDIYWHADMTKSELSRETPHYPLPVVSERAYPGAGGNAAANIAALKPKSLTPVFLYGDDWRGMLLSSILQKSGMNTSLAVETPGRFTNAYCKPMRRGISDVEYEDARLDFTSYSPINEETENAVIRNLEKLAEGIKVLCVSDQFMYGIIGDRVSKKIICLAKNGLPVVVDSRYNIGKYTDCILKPNEVECWRAVCGNEGYISASGDEFAAAAKALALKNNARVLCTLGSNGSIYTDGDESVDIPAVKLSGAIDVCGAGDTFLAAFSSCIGAGASPREAAELASAASAVTVKKIGVTGTASAEEILSVIK